MSDELTGKRALVTGSAQGLGRSIAEALAEQGCRVLINCAHSPEKAETVCRVLREKGFVAEQLICDITNEAEVREKSGMRGLIFWSTTPARILTGVRRK